MNRTIFRIVHANDVPLTPTMNVKRVFPNQSFKNIDPFVFLDHFGPTYHKTGSGGFEKGTGAHPHRGFITFTYMFEGDMEHKDSRGNHNIISAGGVQWMKAASGIMHDEKPPKAFLEKGGNIHGLQLWINLPARHKSDTPQYQPLPSEEVPTYADANGNIIRILLGEYEGLKSPIPTYTPMNVLHVRVAPESVATLSFLDDWNVGAYVPLQSISIDNQTLNAGDFAVFNKTNENISLVNSHTETQDIVILAGKPIGEPIITYGPFVMNTLEGVQMAYNDFQEGKYGEIL